MKIETITLIGFRCFDPHPTRIRLDAGITALVGNNGSGKTALLAALMRCFGVTEAQRTVRRRDFHLSADQHEIASGATLSIDVVLAFPELGGQGSQDATAVSDFFHHMSASKTGAPLKARVRLQAAWIEDGTPDGTVEEDMRWVQTLSNKFDWDKCKRVSPIERAAIQLVYVPATRNVSDQVTNLLKGRLWRAARWSNPLIEAIETSSADLQKGFEKEKPAKFITKRLERRWQQLHEADTDTTPVLRLIDSHLSDLVRRAEFAFFPDEEGRVRAIADLSDGQRSLFHIALTAATLEIERDVLALKPDQSPFDQEKLRRTHLTILAIEEPENSLAPFFLSRIITQACEVSALPSAQVVVSSHSASILGRIEPEEVRYFRLEKTSRISAVRSLTLAADDDEAKGVPDLCARISTLRGSHYSRTGAPTRLWLPSNASLRLGLILTPARLRRGRR